MHKKKYELTEKKYKVEFSACSELSEDDIRLLSNLCSHIADDLSSAREVVRDFIFGLNWNQETYELGKAVSKAMAYIQNIARPHKKEQE